MCRGNGKTFWIGALFGTIIGGVTALLLAPKAGKEMRKDMSKCCDEVSDKTKDACYTMCEEAERLVKKAKEIAEDAKEIASCISDKFRR